MEKPISRKMHGVADYAYAPLMFAAPEISGFIDEDKAVTVSRIVGGGVLAATMLTKAEWGVYKLLPFKTHLALDVAVSLFSFAAPWIFGFSNNKRARNTYLAMGAIGAVVTSLTQPYEMGAGIKITDDDII